MIRLAGQGIAADGSHRTWTVAEGRRGRRWREVVGIDGAVGWSLLYETGPDRGFRHLELAGPGGLATLHPEGDGTLHGNVVDGAGVRHVEGLAFAPGTAMVVAGSVMAGAAIAWAGVAAGDAAVILDPATLELDVGRVSASDLSVIDGDGIPQLDDARTWALERDG